MERLVGHSQLVVQQRLELGEALLGFETRNKYAIQTPANESAFYCAEQQKGFVGFLARQFFGHWRSFELLFFDAQGNIVWRAEHPFRFIFQRLDLYDSSDLFFGSVEWQWGIFRKRFRLTEPRSGRTYNIDSGFLNFWTFTVTHQGRRVGQILKRWSGLLKEMFTDADNFLVEFNSDLTARDRALILSTAILVDLQYFESKGSGRTQLTDLLPD